MRSWLTIFFLLMFALFPASSASAQVSLHLDNSAVQTSGEEPGIGLRLLDAPASTQNDPRARSYIVDHLKPGSTIKRRVQIVNGTAEAQNFRFYPSAATVADDAFRPSSGEEPNELTTWTTLDKPKLTLEPGTRTEVLATIDVPQDAPEGEQYAVIWAEAQPTNKSAEGIINVGRVGVRVYLSVGPGNGPPADFSIDSLTPGRNAESAPELTSIITNTGGRAVDLNGTLMLKDGPAGLSAGPTPVDEGTTIAPGKSAPVHVTLPAELPNGPWQATLELEHGLVSHKATATIEFPEAGQGVEVEAKTGMSAVLIAALAAGAVLVIAGLLVWFSRRRKATQARISDRE